MSHSKRNTSLAFFTSHERSLLKTTWGSQATRLTRDSFLPFGSCQLCLLPSRDPVACTSGDVFCRECAVSNLLAQRKEIKRLEKQQERQQAEEEEERAQEDEAARERAVREFEAVQMGLEVKLGKGVGSRVVGREGGKVVVEEETAGSPNGANKSKKRKFEIDEEELLRIAQEERIRAKRALSEERREAARSSLPSFWVPSQTPGATDSSTALHPTPKPKKLTPTCPASSATSPHEYSLKTLVSIHFTEERDAQTNTPVRSCPACRKALSNATKAMLTIPCGHVLCKPCVTKFMTPQHSTLDAHDPEAEFDTLRCYVCETDLSGRKSAAAKEGKEGKKEKDKEKLKPGLVELRSEGTGFAGGGKNVVQREGAAFQC